MNYSRGKHRVEAPLRLFRFGLINTGAIFISTLLSLVNDFNGTVKYRRTWRMKKYRTLLSSLKNLTSKRAAKNGRKKERKKKKNEEKNRVKIEEFVRLSFSCTVKRYYKYRVCQKSISTEINLKLMKLVFFHILMFYWKRKKKK